MTRTKSILILAVVTFLTFGNSLTNDLIGDAKSIFAENAFYRDPRNVRRLFQKDFIMTPAQMEESPVREISFSGCISYRPVTALSFFADFFLWKDNPFGHHLTSVILHVLAACLVFVLAALLTQNDKVALLAALLFGTHPVQCEVINNTGYRSDILAAIFYLTAFIGYAKSRHAPAGRKGGWLFLAVLAFLLSLFSKEAALTLPAMILACDYFFPAGRTLRATLRKNARSYAALALAAAFYLIIYFFVVPSAFYPKFLFFGLDKVSHLVIALKIFVHYLKVLAFPFAVTILPPLYAPSASPVTLLPLLSAGAFIAAGAALVVKYRRRNPPLAFAAAWFFVNVLPVANIIPLPNPLAYRFLYLPSVGFFIVLALALDRLAIVLRRKRTAMDVGLILKITLVGLYVSVAIPLNAFFKNNIVNCREMVARYPESSRPYWILGLSHFDQREYDKAARYFREYLRRDVGNPFICNVGQNYLARLMLGRCYLNEPDEAIRQFRRAIALKPDFIIAHADLAKAYILKGDFQRALASATRAVELYDRYTLAYVYAAHSCVELGDFDRAEALLAAARRISPEDENIKHAADFLRRKKELR